MASSSVKRVQDKLFGRNLQSDDTSPQEKVDSSTPTLSISIPKPQSPPTLPRKTTDSSPKQDAADDTFNQTTETMPQTYPYRKRLAQQLGDEYKGAERYRLRQDDQRKKHWKRWGPYLSDRQWVRSWRSHFAILFICLI